MNNGYHSVPARHATRIVPGIYALGAGEGTISVSATRDRLRGVSRAARLKGWPIGTEVRVRLNAQDSSAQLQPMSDSDLPNAAFSAVELDVYRYMIENGGIASRRRLTETLIAKGTASIATIASIFAHSPVLKPAGHGIFVLRKWPVDAERLRRARMEVGMDENAGPTASALRAIVDAEGFLQWDTIIDTRSLRTDEHPVPAHIAAAITVGNYDLVNGDGHLNVRTAGTRVHGVASIAIRQRWPMRTEVRIRLNPQKFTAYVLPMSVSDTGANRRSSGVKPVA